MSESVVPPNLEIKKAVLELQGKTVEAQKKYKIANIQIDTWKREKARAELTEKELEKMDSSVKMYEALGRLFIYKDKETIQNHLKERYTTAGEKIATLENSKSILARSVEESESNLRELVQQWRAKADD